MFASATQCVMKYNQIARTSLLAIDDMRSEIRILSKEEWQMLVDKKCKDRLEFLDLPAKEAQEKADQILSPKSFHPIIEQDPWHDSLPTIWDEIYS